MKTLREFYDIIVTSIFLFVFITTGYTMDVITKTPLYMTIPILIAEAVIFLFIFAFNERKKRK